MKKNSQLEGTYKTRLSYSESIKDKSGNGNKLNNNNPVLKIQDQQFKEFILENLIGMQNVNSVNLENTFRKNSLATNNKNYFSYSKTLNQKLSQTYSKFASKEISKKEVRENSQKFLKNNYLKNHSMKNVNNINNFALNSPNNLKKISSEELNSKIKDFENDDLKNIPKNLSDKILKFRNEAKKKLELTGLKIYDIDIEEKENDFTFKDQNSVIEENSDISKEFKNSNEKFLEKDLNKSLYNIKKNIDNNFKNDYNDNNNQIKDNLKSKLTIQLPNANYEKDAFFNFDKKMIMNKIDKKNEKNAENENIHKKKITHEDIDEPIQLKEKSQNDEKELFRFIHRREKVEDSFSEDENYEVPEVISVAGECIIENDSTFLKYWDLIISLITLYTLLVSPFRLAFTDIDYYELDFFEMLMDIAFIIDIVLQFFIPYYNNEEDLVKSKSKIAKHYLSTWFFFDLLASIPGSLISFFFLNTSNISTEPSNADGLSKINKITRISKLYKILKFTKLSKLIKLSNDKNKNKAKNVPSIEDFNVNSQIKRLVNFFIVFILISHIITCFWIFLGGSAYPNWIVVKGLLDSSTGELYVASLYFHWTTIFTIGYGDILASNTLERLYNNILMFVGVLVYSFAVSSLGTIVSGFDGLTAKFMKNMEQLQDITYRYKIPDEFNEKVYKYLRYDLKFNKKEKFSFINELPIRMKNSLLINMYKEVIANFRFLRENSGEFTSKVVFMMKPLRMYFKEYIITEGEFLEEVIFVRQGHITVHLGKYYKESKVMEIRKNEHFGDILVLSNLRSPVTIKVGSKVCDLLIIKKQDLLEIAADFPESIEEIFLISSFNYSALMDIIEEKKRKVEAQRQILKNRKIEFVNYLTVNDNELAKKINNFQSDEAKVKLPKFEKIKKFNENKLIEKLENFSEMNKEDEIENIINNKTNNLNIDQHEYENFKRKSVNNSRIQEFELSKIDINSSDSRNYRSNKDKSLSDKTNRENLIESENVDIDLNKSKSLSSNSCKVNDEYDYCVTNSNNINEESKILNNNDNNVKEKFNNINKIKSLDVKMGGNKKEIRTQSDHKDSKASNKTIKINLENQPNNFLINSFHYNDISNNSEEIELSSRKINELKNSKELKFPLNNSLFDSNKKSFRNDCLEKENPETQKVERKFDNYVQKDKSLNRVMSMKNVSNLQLNQINKKKSSDYSLSSRENKFQYKKINSNFEKINEKENSENYHSDNNSILKELTPKNINNTYSIIYNEDDYDNENSYNNFSPKNSECNKKLIKNDRKKYSFNQNKSPNNILKCENCKNLNEKNSLKNFPAENLQDKNIKKVTNIYNNCQINQTINTKNSKIKKISKKNIESEKEISTSKNFFRRKGKENYKRKRILKEKDSLTFKKSKKICDALKNVIFSSQNIINNPREFYLKEFRVLFNSGLKEEVKIEAKLINSLLIKILKLKKFKEKIGFLDGFDKVMLKENVGTKEKEENFNENDSEYSEINVLNVPYIDED